MYKEDFDIITQVMSRAGLREESLCSPRKAGGQCLHELFPDYKCNKAEGVWRWLCRLPSVDLYGRSRGSDQPVSHFTQFSLKDIYNRAVVWKLHKTKGEIHSV